MLDSILKTTALAALMTLPGFAHADSWTLDSAASIVSFGSIKNDYIGEAHSFSGLAGSVSDAGLAEVEIDLTSVQTNIDIRNERMGEFVFGGIATAKMMAELDMAALTALAPGEGMVQEVDGTLLLLNEEIPVFVDMHILRVSDTQVMATTNTPLFLATDELGVDAGIDTLQELASLDTISRSTPVTMRLMFHAEASGY